jgi:SAM-dependent methyltransferase
VNHADHVALLREGVPSPGGLWTDLGSGGGAFTLALAELLGPGGRIFSVDRDQHALSRQAAELAARFPDVAVESLFDDFTRPLDLPPLDGVVMANSLHFVRDKLPVLELVRGYLKEGGGLILVEYDTDRGNQWVPYPLTYDHFASLAAEAGFGHVRRLATRPSSFLGGVYSALAAR